MTNYTDGVRDDTSLIIGIAGASGSGKTVTALLIAEGLAGDDGEVAFIDTVPPIYVREFHKAGA